MSSVSSGSSRRADDATMVEGAVGPEPSQSLREDRLADCGVVRRKDFQLIYRNESVGIGGKSLCDRGEMTDLDVCANDRDRRSGCRQQQAERYPQRSGRSWSIVFVFSPLTWWS